MIRILQIYILMNEIFTELLLNPCKFTKAMYSLTIRRLSYHFLISVVPEAIRTYVKVW